MPLASDVKNKGMGLKARIILYGAPRTKKSWWALAAGEFGFNHLYIDGEHSQHIIKNIPDEWLQRTLVLDVRDEVGNQCYAKFLTKFLTGAQMLWDEQAKREVNVGGTLNPDHSHVLLNATKLTVNDLVTMDSYTATVSSTREQDAKALGLDLSDGAAAIAAKDSGAMREVYHADGVGLEWVLNAFTKLPCHTIMVGHVFNYEIHDKEGKVVDVRRQLKSSSGPHGMTIVSKFSDVLYFEMIGTAHKISTEAHQKRDGGCRVLAPGLYDWAKLQFVDYCRESNIQKPPADLPPSAAFIWYAPGEVPPAWQKKAPPPPLPSSAPTTTITTGLKPPAPKAIPLSLLKKGS